MTTTKQAKPLAERLRGAGLSKCASEVDALVAENEKLRNELINIANAKPSTWEGAEDQFQPWAQSRARAALGETKS